MKYTLIILWFISLMLAACTPNTTMFNSAEATPDFTPTPLPTPVRVFQATISADGRVVLPLAPQRFSFPAGLDGRIKNLSVVPGQRVKMGQLLAEIDDTDLQNAVKKVEASLAILQADINNQNAAPLASDIAEAQSNLKVAQAELKRVLALPSAEAITRAAADLRLQEVELRQAQEAYDAVAYAQGLGMSPQAAQLQQATLNHEKAQAAYDEATKPASESDIAAARLRVTEAENRLQKLLAGIRPEAEVLNNARIAQTKLDLAEAQANVMKAKMYAPWDGEVVEVNAAVGVHISTASVTLAQLTPLRFATTNFSERNLAEVKVGDKATLFLKSHPAVPFPAIVQRIELDSTQKDGDTALFTVYFDFNPGDLLIHPGMTGRVEITLEPSK